VIFKADASGHSGKQRIVFAKTDIEAGPESSAPLAHEDCASLDDVSVEALDAEALSLAIAPVA
jgi:hypothetical protein